MTKLYADLEADVKELAKILKYTKSHSWNVKLEYDIPVDFR